MQLKEKTIRELQKIIKEDYGKEITAEEASDLGASLLRLTNLVLKNRVKKEKTENIQNP